MDLSFIDARKIVSKDLKHMQNFLQLLMDVIVLIAETQEEEEEEGDGDPKAALKKQFGSDKNKDSDKKGDKAAKPADADEEEDIQKLANDMGLDAGDDLSPEI